MRKPWYAMSVSEVLQALKVDAEQGLSPRLAGERLRRYGSNTLPQRCPPTLGRLFLAQFEDVTVLTLLAATVVSGLLGEWSDAATIVCILVLNACLGVFQEYRAERALEALQRLSAPEARVLRGKKEVRIPAAEVVVGDVVLLEAGDRVPADLRLIEAWSLQVEESALTGESHPVSKQVEPLAKEGLPLGEQANMVFLGTVVVRGRGKGIAVATGTHTQMGRIAHLLREAEGNGTPLQRRLAHLGRLVVAGCLAVCLAIFAVGLAYGRPLREMFLTGVSLAVAAIPEGLPAVVTIVLALGVQRMGRRQAIVRRLAAVETLGSATVICADKTGTLTQNRMRARVLFVDGRKVEAAALSPRSLSDPRFPGLRRLGEIAALCHALPRGQVGLKEGEEGEEPGDPTEWALVRLARALGIRLRELQENWEFLAELPFEAERRMMTVCYRPPGGVPLAFSKGAVDALLARSRAVFSGGRAEPLTEERRASFLRVQEELGRQGLRVLALAFRPLSEEEVRSLQRLGPGGEAAPPVEERLILVGLVGLNDPPRPEVKEAVSKAAAAGIRTIMVTGDHPLTAGAVAREVGILTEGEEVLTGMDLDELSEQQLRAAVKRCRVFARVTPRHKLRLVQALKAEGEVVAMTGDGVNDAPALQEADIGIAMGRTGTDVARGAAAMVLADDNYATIVAAVEEGRSIYQSIRRFIRYLLACNAGEVLTMLIAAAANLPFPLTATQLLWMNLVTDGLPALGLGMGPADPDLMRQPPRAPGEPILTRRLMATIAKQGALFSFCTLAAFLSLLLQGQGEEKARTAAFTALVLAQLAYALRCQGPRWLWTRGGNAFLFWAVLFSAGVHLAFLYLPPLAGLLHAVPLDLGSWLVIGAAILFGVFLSDFCWPWLRRQIQDH
ncbi:MAG: cation-translocating P-type ATPase [Bacillota bacterium]|nr:cation-translocating P-type ATPase [Bacillota bacterium]